MVRITKMAFDLVPQTADGEQFVTPYTYIFRGVFFDWLSAVDPDLVSRLHQKQPKGNPLYYTKYMIQQDTIFHDYLGNKTNADINARSQNHFNEASNKRQSSGLRFTVLLFDESLTKATLDHILNTHSQTIQFGPQQAEISKIAIETINTEEFTRNTQPLHSVSMRFLTPTYFSAMGRYYEMRFPLPIYVFGNLLKFWNAIHQHSIPLMEIRKDFYSWIYKSVFAASFQLETKAWESGKDRKMVGVTGWVSYVSKDNTEYFSRCWDTLTRFGLLIGVGNERTVNFGRFNIQKTQCDNTQKKDLSSVLLPIESEDLIPSGLE